MKMIFSINKPKTPKSQKIKQTRVKPQIINNTEPSIPESFNFFQKTAMFKQILLPNKCGACGK
jgi:hypothetical protein